MIVWPLPEDKHDRLALMVHESWHRIQGDIGFPGSEADNALSIPKTAAFGCSSNGGR